MPTARVKTDGVNLRRTPRVEPDNFIAALPLAQEVELLGQPSGQDFVEVETSLGNGPVRGFVRSDFLRQPVGALKEALLQEAIREWIRFGRGSGNETADPFFEFIADFWQSIGLNLDGRDTDQPWSAAYISFIVRRAGYTEFIFSPAHARYILDARQRRESNDTNAPFWLFRLSEHRPQLGDLICLRRQPGISFTNLPADGFKSHCDVVVEIRDRTIRTLGGNVRNSVSLSTFSLNENGFLREQGTLIGIMRNNTPGG
jgi:hypothetical protein